MCCRLVRGWTVAASGFSRTYSRRQTLGCEQFPQFVAFHHLDFEQPARDAFELVTVGREDRLRFVMRFGDDALDLRVDLFGGGLGVEAALLAGQVEETRA